MNKNNLVDLDYFYFKKRGNGFPFPRHVRSAQNKIDFLCEIVSSCLEAGYERRDLVFILEGLKAVSQQHRKNDLKKGDKNVVTKIW